MAKDETEKLSVPSFGAAPTNTFVAPKFHLQDPRLWHYRVFVLRVIDGDTVVCLRDLGTHRYNVLKVRLAGVDAPEMRPRIGTPAERAAEKILAAASSKRLEELIGEREIVIKTEKTGKFGRWLAYLFIPGSETKTANQVLLEEGHAVVYGTPRPWRAAEAKKLKG